MFTTKALFNKPAARPVLSRNALFGVLIAVAVVTLLLLLIRPLLGPAWSTPGSPQLYLTGVVGSLFSLAPLAFFLAKRSGRSDSPPTWFIIHVVFSSIGIGLLIIHSGLHLTRPPALLLLGGLFLIAQGSWARIILPLQISATFGTKYRSFSAAAKPDKNRLAQIIQAKQKLLKTLAPDQSEATFSPLLIHWWRHPLLTWQYQKLIREEMNIIGQRRAVPALQAYWRGVHMLVAFLFLLGLIVHVITVTFFAGYVAGDGEIHWWHIADWG